MSGIKWELHKITCDVTKKIDDNIKRESLLTFLLVVVTEVTLKKLSSRPCVEHCRALFNFLMPFLIRSSLK